MSSYIYTVIFQILPNHIFQNISEFLTPKDITQLVLTSRNVRLQVGQTIEKSFQQQKMILQSKKYQNENLEPECIKNYQKSLKHAKSFENKDDYVTFIYQLLNSNNTEFYQNLFSAILDRDIQITENNLSIKKSTLIYFHEEVCQNLQKLQSIDTIPSFKVKRVEFYGTYPQQIAKLVKFSNKFLKNLEVIQQFSQEDTQLKKYMDSKKYIQDNIYLEKLVLKCQYQQPVYYLRFDKSFHNYIRFNTGTIIFSFLSIQDLNNLCKVDKIFAHSIFKSIQILRNIFQSKYNQLKEIPTRIQVQKVSKLYQKCKAIPISVHHFQQIKFFYNPPIAVDRTFEALQKVFQKNISSSFQRRIVQIYEDKNLLNFVLNPKFIDLNEKQVEFIDYLLQQLTSDQAKRCSLLCYSIYTSLKMNYLLKRNNIRIEEIESHNKIQKETLSILKYLEDLDTFQKQQTGDGKPQNMIQNEFELQDKQIQQI